MRLEHLIPLQKKRYINFTLDKNPQCKSGKLRVWLHAEKDKVYHCRVIQPTGLIKYERTETLRKFGNRSKRDNADWMYLKHVVQFFSTCLKQKT